MTRRLLRLRYAAWGAYCYLLRLLPYFPHPTAWHFCLDLAEEQRDLIRAELEVQP